MMPGPLGQTDFTVFMPFTLAAFIVVWSIIVVSGFIPLGPREYRVPALLMVCVAATFVFALVAKLALVTAKLPWPVAIVVLGVAILGAPFLAEPMPQKLRESVLALVLVIGLTMLGIALLYLVL